MTEGINNVFDRISEIKSMGKSFNKSVKPEALADFENMLKEKMSADDAKKDSSITTIHPFLNPIPSVSDIQTLDSVNSISESPVNDAEKIKLINSKIKEKSAKYNVSEKLINAVIRVESNFDQHAVSRVGAMGLMQLMPKTALEMGVNKPFDIEDNIEGGVKYMRLLLDKYDGDVVKSLAAYNAGPTRVDNAGGVPDIKETQDYVKKINNILINQE